jgi:mycothiol synthase
MRHILKLHRSLTQDIPDPSHTYEITTFNPKFHKEEWLSLNNKIFANHPDQGNWAMADLENRISEPWFDPEGFFIAIENKRIIGFCWTKIHHDFVNQDPVGELYVLGVDPEFQVKGIGHSLATRALNHFLNLGIHQASVYVDQENFPALSLYRKLLFH